MEKYSAKKNENKYYEGKDDHNQGYNARKVISEGYAFFNCSVLSLVGNVNTRRMSQPDME